MLNFETKVPSGPPLVVRAGTTVVWNKVTYKVCNASKEKIYLRSDDADPIPLSRAIFSDLFRKREIVLSSEPSFASDQIESEVRGYLRSLSPEKVRIGRRRGQFLAALSVHPSTDPKHFDLEEVSDRTIQRWKKNAKWSVERYGTSFWGLVDQPRPGRPRQVFGDEMLQDMDSIADELYFTPDRRSGTFVWRQLRKRRRERGLRFPSREAFRQFLRRKKNLHDTTKARVSPRAAYPFGRGDSSVENWLTKGDFPFKLGQSDSKRVDLVLLDEETGEVLGCPWLTTIVLPHYGRVPIGYALMFEPPSYRSSTLAIRDAFERYGEFCSFLLVDNGSEFNNATYDKLIALLGCSKINRPKSDPRSSAQVESSYRTLDVEFVHNLSGNIKPLKNPREASEKSDPEKRAVWTLTEFDTLLRRYLFTDLWDAPSADLGTTPRSAFERDRARAPDRSHEIVITPDIETVAFLPEVRGRTRVVQPGRGVSVAGYYYWHDKMLEPSVEREKVLVRYDPYELYTVYCQIEGDWIPCVARFAPELRNVSERTRHLRVLARRRLRATHAARREATHGVKLENLGADTLKTEKERLEERKQRAQEKVRKQGAEPTSQAKDTPEPKPAIPSLDFTHLRDNAA